MGSTNHEYTNAGEYTNNGCMYAHDWCMVPTIGQLLNGINSNSMDLTYYSLVAVCSNLCPFVPPTLNSLRHGISRTRIVSDKKVPWMSVQFHYMLNQVAHHTHCSIVPGGSESFTGPPHSKSGGAKTVVSMCHQQGFSPRPPRIEE